MFSQQQTQPGELESDTIAAVATPAGQGALGVIRISGREARVLGMKLTGRDSLAPRTALLSNFLDESQVVIDQGIAIYFPGPASFTGEDVVELQAHGSPVVLSMLMRALAAHGARAARPGEFTERAFLNGKLDLAQAEAVADLIESASERAARSALRSLQGAFSQHIRELIEALVQLRAQVEAGLDFSDEEIDYEDEAALAGRFAEVLAKLDETRRRARSGARLRDGIRIVISGPPNVGKSTLLNRLSGVDRAIVTPVPGTTRDLLHQDLVLNGLPLHLIDTAGLRDTQEAIELEGMRRAREAADTADHVIWVDEYQPGMENDDAPAALAAAGRSFTLVRNKIDLYDCPPLHRQGPPFDMLLVSAKTGAGIELLHKRLLSIAGVDEASRGDFTARARHVEALESAGAFLECAREELSLQRLELTAEHLRLAQLRLAEISGDFTSDDLLSEIFSSFCIGK